jgi:hypothetical protein
MVSIQPIANSYVPETESCFLLPKTKTYRKGSVMSVLVSQSPLYAYLAQVGNLDDDLDSPEFNGTCFAPCKEYSKRYYHLFFNNIDHLRARNLVLSSLLRAPMYKKDLAKNQIIPTLFRYSSICVNPYTDSGCLNINNMPIINGDLTCKNGVLHILSGLIQ